MTRLAINNKSTHGGDCSFTSKLEKTSQGKVIMFFKHEWDSESDTIFFSQSLYHTGMINDSPSPCFPQHPLSHCLAYQGVPFCLKFVKPFCPKNKSFHSMKSLVSRVFRVFLHHLKFPPRSSKIQRILKICRGKIFWMHFSIILF